MKKQFRKMHVLMHQLNNKQRKILQLLTNRTPSKKTETPTSPPKSPTLSQQKELKRAEMKKSLPKQLTTQETVDALDTTDSNFYRNVFRQLLFPIDKTNDCKQPRYHRRDVINLALKVSHEPGAHTFSKLNKERKASEKK